MMGGGRAADAYVQSDAKIGVEELEKLLAARGVKGTGYRTPDVKSKLVNHNADRTEFQIEPGTVDPREAVHRHGPDRAAGDRRAVGQRHDLGVLQHADDAPARAGAGRPLLRLHRADAAGGDGSGRGDGASPPCCSTATRA